MVSRLISKRKTKQKTTFTAYLIPPTQYILTHIFFIDFRQIAGVATKIT